MIIIPAIDLKDGQCVRLRKGVMEDSTVFSEDPVMMAKQWVDQGTQRLHLVDLNGAFAGERSSFFQKVALVLSWSIMNSHAAKALAR